MGRTRTTEQDRTREPCATEPQELSTGHLRRKILRTHVPPSCSSQRRPSCPEPLIFTSTKTGGHFHGCGQGRGRKGWRSRTQTSPSKKKRASYWPPLWSNRRENVRLPSAFLNNFSRPG